MREMSISERRKAYVGLLFMGGLVTLYSILMWDMPFEYVHVFTRYYPIFWGMVCLEFIYLDRNRPYGLNFIRGYSGYMSCYNCYKPIDKYLNVLNIITFGVAVFFHPLLSLEGKSETYYTGLCEIYTELIGFLIVLYILCFTNCKQELFSWGKINKDIPKEESEEAKEWEGVLHDGSTGDVATDDVSTEEEVNKDETKEDVSLKE